jgi:hypothetical protein
MADSFAGVTLKGSELRYEKTRGPVAGAQARVENGADVEMRRTLGRVLTRGIFAKKKLTGHIYLTIEHPDYEVAVEVPAKKESEARKFAALVNTAAKR